MFPGRFSYFQGIDLKGTTLPEGDARGRSAGKPGGKCARQGDGELVGEDGDPSDFDTDAHDACESEHFEGEKTAYAFDEKCLLLQDCFEGS